MPTDPTELFLNHEELDYFAHQFGDKIEYSKNGDNLVLDFVTENGKLEGNQHIKIEVSTRQLIECTKELSPFTGIKVEKFLINGLELNDYTIFVSPRDITNSQFAGGDMADADTRTIVMHQLKTGDDLAVLFHEIGHVDAGHNGSNRAKLEVEIAEALGPNYTVGDEISIKAQELLAQRFNQELEANTYGVAKIKYFMGAVYRNDPDLSKVKAYLDEEIARQYKTPK